MFKKANRLTTKEFSHFFATGKRHHFPHLTVIMTKHNTLKVAVVVGKKVVKSAAKRNLLKRRVLAELVKGDLPPAVYIVLLKPTFATLSRKTANQAVVSAIALLAKSK
jgi:ribonuclease P protein component